MMGRLDRVNRIRRADWVEYDRRIEQNR
jgi:hypothetical protein